MRPVPAHRGYRPSPQDLPTGPPHGGEPVNRIIRKPGRGWAYTGITLGGLVSVAANVAHSFIPPPTAVAGWHPESGAVVGAIVWPVFLFIAIEILTRVTWPNGLWWRLTRWG